VVFHEMVPEFMLLLGLMASSSMSQNVAKE